MLSTPGWPNRRQNCLQKTCLDPPKDKYSSTPVVLLNYSALYNTWSHLDKRRAHTPHKVNTYIYKQEQGSPQEQRLSRP